LIHADFVLMAKFSSIWLPPPFGDMYKCIAEMV
jgi:hypothetical protein